MPPTCMPMILLTQNRATALNMDHVYDLSVYDCTIYATVGYDSDRKPIEVMVGDYPEGPDAAADVLRKVVETIADGFGLVEMPLGAD